MIGDKLKEAAVFHPEEIIAATGARLVSGVAGENVSGVSIDSRTIQPGELFVAIRGRRLDGHDFVEAAFERGAAGAIVDRPSTSSGRTDPGVPIWGVKNTLRAFGELARFHRSRFDLKVVAITGSNGKTTTKTILNHLLSGSQEVLATQGTQNNLIGVPLTLLRLGPWHQAAVVELGTNQWGEIRRLTQIARPSVGVITNIGLAHLETFGDLHGVLRAKAELWEAMESKGPLVLNADDPLLWEEGKQLPHRVVWFGCNPKAQIQASQVRLESWGSHCLVNDRWELQLPLPGQHNLMNALAALACVQALGFEIPLALQRLESIPSLSGRLSQIQRDGCLIIDDTYNANPASLKVALEVLAGMESPGRRIAVIGDMLELGDQGPRLHAQAGGWVVQSKVDFLITVGPLSKHLLVAARQEGLVEEAGRAFDTTQEAGEFLEGLIHVGDTILLKGSRGMQMERVYVCSTTSSTH